MKATSKCFTNMHLIYIKKNFLSRGNAFLSFIFLIILIMSFYDLFVFILTGLFLLFVFFFSFFFEFLFTHL